MSLYTNRRGKLSVLQTPRVNLRKKNKRRRSIVYVSREGVFICQVECIPIPLFLFSKYEAIFLKLSHFTVCTFGKM